MIFFHFHQVAVMSSEDLFFYFVLPCYVEHSFFLFHPPKVGLLQGTRGGKRTRIEMDQKQRREE